MKNILTQERLKQVLHYTPETGVFTRIQVARASHARFLGLPAGRLDSHGHRQIGVDGPKYAAHRLAWLYVTGKWPQAEIDHKNGDRDDNSFSNLREATRQQNACNTATRENTSGFKGVSYYKTRNCWLARITHNKKVRFLGYYESKEEASKVYQHASQELHKEFAR